MRPVDITPENANKLWQRIYGSTILQSPPKANFLENDAVRIALEKPVFRKGYFPTFSDEIFRIHRVIRGNRSPTYYYLRDYKGEKLKGRFYAQDLARTREDAETTYRIEKILQKKRNRDGELELKVLFVGYPNDTYWIKQSDLVA